MTPDTPAPPILGDIRPDPCGIMLSTGYQRFRSPSGIQGLAKWSDDRLDILVVYTDVRGAGRFRDFIAAAKRERRTVCVWDVWNPVVVGSLMRYGFTRETDIQGDGEVVEGFRWDAPE